MSKPLDSLRKNAEAAKAEVSPSTRADVRERSARAVAKVVAKIDRQERMEATRLPQSKSDVSAQEKS